MKHSILVIHHIFVLFLILNAIVLHICLHLSLLIALISTLASKLPIGLLIIAWNVFHLTYIIYLLSLIVFTT
jgi:hypothetical protein